MKTILITLCCLLYAAQLSAVENTPNLSIEYLLKNGYLKMSAEEIHAQLIDKTLTVLDLQAGSKYKAIFLKDGARELKKIKEAHPSSLTDAEYQGRAETLTGKASFFLEGDKVISSDGVRTYSILLYQKDDEIYGMRDVDYGHIHFQIKIK